MQRVEDELEVLKGDEVVHVRPLGGHALMIGRQSDNDLQLADARVSSHHLVLRWSGTRLLAHDLGSKNGTYLNGTLLGGPAELRDGDHLRLGNAVDLRVRLGNRGGGERNARRLSVLDLDSGVVYPVRGGRFRVGARPGSDLRLLDGPEVAATMTVHPDGEIWLGDDELERPIEAGEPFQVAGHRMILRDEPAVPQETDTELARPGNPYAYQLRVISQGPQGPEAWLEDPLARLRHVVRAENRVALLAVLARRAQEDRARGVRRDLRGWVSDEEAIQAIWGPRADSLGANNFQVLICRLRKEITDAGLDGWFIQKRAGATRVALDEVEVSPTG